MFKLLGTLSALFIVPLAINAAYPGTQDYSQQVQDYQIQSNQRYPDMNYRTFKNQGDRFLNQQDRNLIIKIRDILEERQLSHNAPNIQIKVKDGIVTLMGFVDSQNEKNNIVDNVKQIRGVREVNGQLKIKPNNSTNPRILRKSQQLWKDQQAYLESRLNRYVSLQQERQNGNQPNSLQQRKTQKDMDLEEKIQERLSTSRFREKLDNVEIEASEGTINMWGTVETEKDLNDLERRIKNIPGVQKVDNNLKVQSSTKNR